MPKLEELLKYVSEHNEFYKNIIKEYGITDPTDIKQYPVLTRHQLQENRYDLFSDGFASKYFYQQLRRQTSSGSSGVAVNVYWDYKDWYASNMSLWRKRLQWYGIHPNDKFVMFTLNAFNVKSDGKTIYYIQDAKNILCVNASLIQNDIGYEKIIDIIEEFAPKWLYIQPFILNRLIYIYKQVGKHPPQTLKYIESVGEILSSDLRRRAIDFFKVPVANMYGSEEMNSIAYECPYHHMHVLEDNVFVEVQNKNGIYGSGEGKAIITNLHNNALPLIRYNQGDIVILKKLNEQCIYGNNAPVISVIKGRKLDAIKLNDQLELSPFLLSEIISEVNNIYKDSIRSYKYIYYKSKHKLICIIDVKDKLWYTNIKNSIIEIFKCKIHDSNNIMLEIIAKENIHLYNKKLKLIEIRE